VTATAEPGKEIARGRDGAIYEYAPGLVLRKMFDGRSIADEARIIQYVGEHGYPVPRIESVSDDGTEIVMERLEGPMMMDVMAKQPWTLPKNVRALADLHDQLHAIRAPDWLRRLEPDGDAVLHLDFHPMNVMMTARGPVVIDWSNAAVGKPLTEIGLSYVLLVGPQMPAPWIVRTLIHPPRVGIGRLFLHRYRGPALAERVAFAAELKQIDDHMAPDELARLQRIARRWHTKAEKSERAPG
jgi:aminoglycoside phosphotransferase (APT) family kinase protein